LTGYPALLEPNMPPPDAIIAAMHTLADKWGADRSIWRYDPVFLSNVTDREWHIQGFKALARALKGAVRRVIISVYDEYAGAKHRIARLEGEGAFRVLPHYDDEGRLLGGVRCLLAELAAIAADEGMAMYACAEGEDLADLGIRRGACIDGALLRELWGIETGGKDKNQRACCLCVPSVDIGRYGPCPAGCVYCYARR
jgi:hypothetical protein